MSTTYTSLQVIFSLVFGIMIVIGWWRMFEKAGEAGWKALVPLYNAYTYFRIAGRNGWGILLLLVPLVNVVVSIIVSLDMAKHFGKGAAYGLLALWLLPFIGALDLGLGQTAYVGPKHD